jgi:hypothetical protein
MDMNSRMAMAEKLSVQQLQQAVQSGSLPAYIGIPLIEQKTKEKAQMAAAQGGQQKPPSVAASILQQADQQEQQERGIDELPSNLPMMEDEEMGMAGGGIVAFAERGRVRDPDEMTAMERLQEENPETYRRILAEDGPQLMVSSDTMDYSGNMQEGSGRSNRDPKVVSPGRAALIGQYRESRPENRYKMPPSNEMPKNTILNPPNAFKNDPGYDSVPASPAGRFIQDKIVDIKGALNTYSLREKLYKQYSPAALGLSNATDAEHVAAQEMLVRIKNMSGPELRALEEQGRPPAMTAVESTSAPVNTRPTAAPTPQPTSTPQAQSFPNEFPEEGASPSAGITAAPGANLAPPGTPGAPRPAPTGATSAPKTAPQGGAPSSGRGALPSTLAAAERSDSSAANQATSMLDKYVAQLEKSGESVGRDKKEAMYMALIQGGLAAAGGMSPNALQNIAQGATLGAQNYQQAMRDIKKEDRARLEKLISAGLKKEEFLLKAEEIGVKRETARMVYDASMARTGALGGGGDKEDRLVRQGYERSGIEYDRAAQLAKRNMANALKDDSAYTGAKTQLAYAKNLKPEDRTKLEKIVRDREAPYLDDITYNRNMAKGFFKKAGVDLSSGGGGKENVDLNQFFK